MKKSEINTYMKMPSVPAGAILDRIVRQQRRTKTEVGSAAQLIPQRLNDLIMGHRRFTPQNSIALENALGIEFAGFFYLLQANHDIYMEKQMAAKKATPNLQILTKTTFWDVDLSKIDWIKNKKWAIIRALEYGSAEEIREIDRFYGHDAIVEVYNNSCNFRLPDIAKHNFEEAFA